MVWLLLSPVKDCNGAQTRRCQPLQSATRPKHRTFEYSGRRAACRANAPWRSPSTEEQHDMFGGLNFTRVNAINLRRRRDISCCIKTILYRLPCNQCSSYRLLRRESIGSNHTVGFLLSLPLTLDCRKGECESKQSRMKVGELLHFGICWMSSKRRKFSTL